MRNEKIRTGKRVEFCVIGLMLYDGLDCYLPLTDDNGIDVIVRKEKGHFIEVQIKGRSKDAGKTALFSAITYDKHEHENYYFVFYLEASREIWIVPSKAFIENASQNKNGKNKGKWSIDLKSSKYNQYKSTDFSMFK
jgi:hypothetical protein